MILCLAWDPSWFDPWHNIISCPKYLWVWSPDQTKPENASHNLCAVLFPFYKIVHCCHRVCQLPLPFTGEQRGIRKHILLVTHQWQIKAFMSDREVRGRSRRPLGPVPWLLSRAGVLEHFLLVFVYSEIKMRSLDIQGCWMVYVVCACHATFLFCKVDVVLVSRV